MRPGGCGIRPRIDIVLTLLPEPDSPTIPSVSPGIDVVRDAVDGVDDAVVGLELDDEIPDRQDGLRHALSAASDRARRAARRR